MKYKDNVLGNNLFNQVSKILTDIHIPYYYSESTAFLDEKPRHIFDGSFSHLVMQNNEQYSNLAPFLEAVCYAAFDNAGVDVDRIIRIRLGLLTPTTETIVHTPHVDFEEPHNSALLYINDSDGDTIFYEERYERSWKDNRSKPQELEFKISDKVSPKANRLVWFDGYQYHSSSTPTKHTKRLVMNINYV